jgi:hypothetical protein
VAHQPEGPLISISQEFLAGDREPQLDELPLLESDGELPSFDRRLLVISRAVLSSSQFETASDPYLGLAERLEAHLSLCD